MALEAQEIELNFGPQHPSTHGVLRLILTLEGETVVDSDAIIGYLHRGVEKIGEDLEYQQFTPYTDRNDYITAITNNLGYLETVEKLLGVEVPPRAQYVRTLFSELCRLSSHLFWLATHALDVGAMTPFFYTTRERELILDFFEEYCGARLTNNAFIVGGLRWDLPEGFLGRVTAFIDDFPGHVQEYETLLTTNRIWMERTQGVGVISAEDAVDWGLSGPTLRGSGVAWDVRKWKPYAAYGDLEFEVPTRPEGDVYARYLVRMEEMRQSVRLVRQCCERMPAGPVKAKVPRAIKPPKGAEAYHAIEAPKGEIGHFIRSNGTTTPERLKIRGPSFVNLQGLRDMILGGMVADVVAAIGSIDIVLGEVDR